MDKIVTIKIIAGKFKGKILNARILPHTRPTKAILKESVFNTIAPFTKDKVFIEAFAGYGSMGFEALSRGAKRVIFIEKNAESFAILQKNISLFESEKGKILAENADSFAILRQERSIIDSGDILYFDPPFGEEFYNQIFASLEAKLTRNSPLKVQNLQSKMLIFEHSTKFTMPNTIAEIPLQKAKKFGRSSVSYYFRHDFC